VLTLQDRSPIAAGHSNGGQIMTSLGMDAPNVVGLVNIAAFGTLLSHVPPAHPLSNLQIDAADFAWLPQADFVNHFAPDVDPEETNVMYAVQQPAHIGTRSYVMGLPVWLHCQPDIWWRVERRVSTGTTNTSQRISKMRDAPAMATTMTQSGDVFGGFVVRNPIRR